MMNLIFHLLSGMLIHHVTCHQDIFPASWATKAATQSRDSQYQAFGSVRQGVRQRILQKIDSLFESFKDRFDKKFTEAEEARRKAIFAKNLEIINEHNKRPGEYKMGITEFTDQTDDEFRNMMLEQSKPLLEKEEAKTSQIAEVKALYARLLQTSSDDAKIKDILSKIPKKLDWTLKGKVSPVRHQLASCQACYVFSAVSGVESAVAIRYNIPDVLSAQEIVDCTKPFGNNGCVGGQPQFAYDYINNNGINLEENYPYVAREQACKAPTQKEALKKRFAYYKPELNVLSLLQYLQYGPVVVNHYVPDSFKYYTSGVFVTNDCYDKQIINHSALLVGYDLTADKPWFKLKNSWGKKWGENGYYKVEIGPLNYENPGFCFLANNGYNVFPTYFG